MPEDDAMEMDSRSAGQGKGSLEELMRERIRGIIEIIVEQELKKPWGPRVQRGWARSAPDIDTDIAREP